MKKLLSTLFLAGGLSAVAAAQSFGLQITEIMFNPPEGGNDSLEFVEIYYGERTSLDISDYTVEIGGSTRLTFPAGTVMGPHAVYNLALPLSTAPNAFENVYGIAPDFLLSGSGLTNSGNTITIKDAAGNIVTSVTYSGTWYPETAGNGSSLNRCNFDADKASSAEGWAPSTTEVTGAIIDGKQLKASPGAAEQCVAITRPVYPIGLINKVNSTTGLPDSINVNCEIRGVVYSNDFNGGAAIEFVIVDAAQNEGIFVYANSQISGYTPAMGDSIHIKGMVSQYNGVTQFTPSNIEVKQSGISLINPTVVTELGHATEGKFIKVENLTVTSTENATASGFNVMAEDANGNTINIRIDADTDAFTTTFAAGTQINHVIGFGTQFDNSNPFTEGFQILPRGLSDIEFVVSVDQLAMNTLSIFPNPVSNVLTIATETAFNSVIVTNTVGQVVAQYHNINNNQFQFNVNNLTNGLYQVTVVTAKGQATKLVNVQK